MKKSQLLPVLNRLAVAYKEAITADVERIKLRIDESIPYPHVTRDGGIIRLDNAVAGIASGDKKLLWVLMRYLQFDYELPMYYNRGSMALHIINRLNHVATVRIHDIYRRKKDRV